MQKRQGDGRSDDMEMTRLESDGSRLMFSLNHISAGKTSVSTVNTEPFYLLQGMQL